MAISVALSPLAVIQFFDNTGKPAVGGTLLTQSGGVNYPTYSEPTGTTALPNPIPLNSRGEISTSAGASSPLFLQTGVSYTFTLKDANGSQLWSIANITSISAFSVSYPASGASSVTATVPGFTAYFDGLRVQLKMGATITGLATLNLNGIGAVNIYYSDLVSQISVGVLLQNGIYDFIYDSSLNSNAGGFIVTNPSRATGSFTLTIATGLTTTPTATVNYAVENDGRGIDVWCPTGVTGTSNATSMTASGVPAAIQTATSKAASAGGLVDNGAGTMGTISITASNGTWTINKLGTGSNWTNTGVKGLGGSAGAEFYAHYTND